MDRFYFNLKSYFKYQNKFFFDKAYHLLEFYKSQDDEIYYEEHQNGNGYVKIIKSNYNDLEIKISLYCNESHEWIIKLSIGEKIKEMPLHYNDEDFDILQIQKELMLCL